MFSIPEDSLVKLCQAPVYMLDVDDTFYSCFNAEGDSLHAAIKTRICDEANRRKDLKDIAEQFGEDGKITPLSVDKAFPPICTRIFQEEGPEGLNAFFGRAYGNDYSIVAADFERNRRLVAALHRLRDFHGKRVVIYTNGPSSGDVSNPLHTERVLQASGVPEGFFNLAKGEATPDQRSGDVYDLTMSIAQSERTGQNRGKPTILGMQDVVDHFGLGNTSFVLFDDSPEACQVARGVTGYKKCTGYGVWVSKKDGAPEEMFAGNEARIEAANGALARTMNLANVLTLVTNHLDAHPHLAKDGQFAVSARTPALQMTCKR